MRGGVDPARETADDHDAEAGEIGGEAAGLGDPVRRGGAGADDRDRGTRDRQRAGDEDALRNVVEIEEPRRKSRVVARATALTSGIAREWAAERSAIATAPISGARLRRGRRTGEHFPFHTFLGRAHPGTVVGERVDLLGGHQVLVAHQAHEALGEHAIAAGDVVHPAAAAVGRHAVERVGDPDRAAPVADRDDRLARAASAAVSLVSSASLEQAPAPRGESRAGRAPARRWCA